MAINSYFPRDRIVFMGLSTDTKPAAAIGSKFIDTDTGAVWIYLNTGSWLQVAAIPASAWTEPSVDI